jgi:glycosyltransferase involved in cell wall biosynthesis
LTDDTLIREQERLGKGPVSGVLLTVVVPVYNEADSILENVRTIRDRVAAGLDAPFELIVVSDGSVDRTEERLLEARDELVKVIHYDRNLGKGYAIKVGALAARGRWIAYVDADLDLDPASIPDYLEVAARESLDFAIGSKRHPESVVRYPRSRRVASWLYQQVVRLLFRLDVRDTQVGLKVYRREIAEQVVPLLLVKRYAFDLELLAVSRSLGFARIRELPVTLDYRFSGSQVGSLEVLRALVDTAAIFYRLHLVGYYDRKRRLLLESGYERSLDYRPRVSLVGGDRYHTDDLGYPDVELLEVGDERNRLEAARGAQGEILAFLEEGGAPAGNWLSAAVLLLRHPDVSAVVAPTVAPAGGSFRDRTAACVWESRLGGGSAYFRFMPGNLRFVHDFPARSVVVKREDFLAAAPSSGSIEDLCSALEDLDKRVLYTPETVIVARRPPFLRPHLAEVARYARERARIVKRRGLRALRASTVGLLLLWPALLAAGVAVASGGAWRLAGVAVLVAYIGTICASGLLSALRSRSLLVGAVVPAALVMTHAAYAGAFARELLRRR